MSGSAVVVFGDMMKLEVSDESEIERYWLRPMFDKFDDFPHGFINLLKVVADIMRCDIRPCVAKAQCNCFAWYVQLGTDGGERVTCHIYRKFGNDRVVDDFPHFSAFVRHEFCFADFLQCSVPMVAEIFV